MPQKTIHDILHNGYIKRYPDGSGTLIIAEKGIFRDPGWEEIGVERRKPLPLAAFMEPDEELLYEKAEIEGKAGLGPGEKPGSDRTVQRAIFRARAKVRDIALCTDFSWFVTLTLDARRIDRYDDAQIVRKLSQWCNNRVKKYGLTYILVPERHKDGAVHFHGFFNGALNGRMSDSGHYDRQGHKVYNCESWTLGFTTAVRLYGDYNRAVAYVCKYIGKAPEKIGGRWYYSGGQLAAPVVERFTADYDAWADVPGYRYTMCNGTPVLLIGFDGEGRWIQPAPEKGGPAGGGGELLPDPGEMKESKV